MAKKEGWQRGQGVYSQVGDGKDRVRQGNSGDKPYGSPRQLDIDVIDSDAKKGGAAKLPKRA